MVVEDLLDPNIVWEKPWLMTLLAFIAPILATLFVYFVRISPEGFTIILLIVMIIYPTMHNLIQHEELFIENIYSDPKKKIEENNFYSRHSHIIKTYSYFFFGTTLSTFLIFISLPNSIRLNLFSLQLLEIQKISGMTMHFINPSKFSEIIYPNLIVLFLTFVLSFVFGTGAVFLLTWNATIVGVYLNVAINNIFYSVTHLHTGFYTALTFMLSWILYGIPEFLGYFLGAISGGVLSVSITRKATKRGLFKKIFYDSLMLLSAAALLIVIAAVIESV